jgi:CspA family cold shock protein
VSKGIVKFYNAERGYGFILDDEGRDIFVHSSVVKLAGLSELRPEQRITFDVEPGGLGGRRAVNLKIVG